MSRGGRASAGPEPKRPGGRRAGASAPKRRPFARDGRAAAPLVFERTHRNGAGEVCGRYDGTDTGNRSRLPSGDRWRRIASERSFAVRAASRRVARPSRARCQPLVPDLVRPRWRRPAGAITSRRSMGVAELRRGHLARPLGGGRRRHAPGRATNQHHRGPRTGARAVTPGYGAPPPRAPPATGAGTRPNAAASPGGLRVYRQRIEAACARSGAGPTHGAAPRETTASRATCWHGIVSGILRQRDDRGAPRSERRVGREWPDAGTPMPSPPVRAPPPSRRLCPLMRSPRRNLRQNHRTPIPNRPRRLRKPPYEGRGSGTRRCAGKYRPHSFIPRTIRTANSTSRFTPWQEPW